MQWTIAAGLLLAAAAAAPPLAAQVKIERLRIGPTERVEDAYPEEAKLVIPAGRDRVYVFVDFRAARNDRIGIEVTAPGNVALFKKLQSYSGDGTASIAMSGADMYRTLARDVELVASSAQKSIDMAQNESVGNLGYLTDAGMNIETLHWAVQVLARFDLDAAAEADLAALEEATDELRGLSEAFLNGSGNKTPERAKAAAAEMAGSAAEAAESALALKDYGDDVTSLAIPETDADPRAAYTINVTVRGNPSLSSEFWVTNAQVPDASATPVNEPLVGNPAATATPGAGGTGSRSSATRTAEAGADAAEGEDQAGGQAQSGGASAGSAAGISAAARATRRAATAVSSGAIAPAPATPEAEPAEVGSISDASGASEAADPASLAALPESAPTWTVPAVAALDPSAPAAADADAGAARAPEGGGGGPNLAILIIGVMGLVAVGVWMRRRM